MSRKMRFDIVVDIRRSHGSFIYDKKSQSYFLDFFNNYSTMPLGWNHPIFQDKNFKEKINDYCDKKIVVGELHTEASSEFLNVFKREAGRGYKYYHFTTSGALAIEAAIKVAIRYKKVQHPIILALQNNFHGIYGYSSFLSDRFYPINNALDGLPRLQNVKHLKPSYSNNTINDYEKELLDIINKYDSRNIVALLIEPIQCTAGDIYLNNEMFNMNYEITRKYDIPLIHDEIQTGFGATGKMWYSEYFKCKPDIIVFGKRSQVCGIMANDRFSDVFESPEQLECTFNGDILDMIRSEYILRAYKSYHILENVNKQAKMLENEFNIFPINGRNKGLLLAMDMKNEDMRNNFSEISKKHKLLCLKGGRSTIRFRPPLSIDTRVLEMGINKIYNVMKEENNYADIS